ncbi:MAG: MFS transporter [Thermoanaerobaculum sp.]|nr:MFS transporter [Thermoanaerobaculum sp.]MDW7968196.1 MFS transporter [Thermoanaerobaculum sp.]
MKARSAALFVGLMGLVSMLADLTYEGARGITGPFLAFLGASALAVGLSSGLGEFAGYALRLVTGLWADKTRGYWTFTFVGYFLNLLAVPLLAFAQRWEWAAALVVLERLGKAVRTPARDALLAQATAVVGHGKGFGLHEVLDQLGAVIGPLVVAWALARELGFSTAFLILAVPAVAALSTLTLARVLFGKVVAGQPAGATQGANFAPRVPSFWWLLAFVALHVAGFAHFQLLAFHLQKHQVLPTVSIPVLFSLAMLVDGAVALPAGWLFDRVGLKALCLVPLVTAPVALLVFTTSPIAAAVGVALWGAAMGLEETILKAAVATLVEAPRRATAFGLFHAVSGLAWLVGSLLLAGLYSQNPLAAGAASLMLQVLALATLLGGLALRSKG